MRIAVFALAVLGACAAHADTLSDYLGEFSQSHADARAAQPSWSSPLVTTTGLLEQRVRFDLSQQHAGNGADTTVLDDSRALDLIVGQPGNPAGHDALPDPAHTGRTHPERLC